MKHKNSSTRKTLIEPIGGHKNRIFISHGNRLGTFSHRRGVMSTEVARLCLHYEVRALLPAPRKNIVAKHVKLRRFLQLIAKWSSSRFRQNWFFTIFFFGWFLLSLQRYMLNSEGTFGCVSIFKVCIVLVMWNWSNPFLQLWSRVDGGSPWLSQSSLTVELKDPSGSFAKVLGTF